MASVKQIQVTFDCAEPERVARFWSEVLGYEHQGSACVDPSGAGPRLYFQRVPEGKVVKNRLHLDVRVGTGSLVHSAWPHSRQNAHDWSRSARYECGYCSPTNTTSRAS